MKARQIQRFIWLILALTWLGPLQAAFTDNGDGTVTDTVTGLMWDQCSWGQTWAAGSGPGARSCTGNASTQTWSAAQGIAVTANAQNSGAGYKNHNDWRLPNRTELVSLVNYATFNPAIDGTAFPNTPASPFWSSTVYARSPVGAWFVVFDYGRVYALNRGSVSLVRLVRSGQSFGAFDVLAPAFALSPATQTVSGAVGAAISATTAFTPTGFSGTVSYAVSPTLPVGLSINPTSGIISGTPTTAQSSANYTVTGTGSVSGSATATVAISIAQGVPTLSIGNSPQTYTGSAIAATVSCLGGGTVSNVRYDGSSTEPTNAGTYVITADCAASSNYSAVTGASAGNLVIAAATPTLSVTNTPTYTGSAIAATVSCQGGGTVSNVRYAGSSTVPTNAGTYAITADCAASSNYSAVTGASAGNLVIAAATPTLSVTNTPTYTGSAIAATVSCLGGGSVSNVRYAGSSTVPTNAGTYAITADCAASSNYSAVTGASAGDFSIAKVTLTITANGQSVPYGTAVNTVTSNGTYTPSGVVNGETATVISGSASYTTTYTATTAPSTAGVTLTPVTTGLSATNYDFTPANGSITVTAATTTVSVTGSQSYTYNGSGQGPATATVTGSGGTVSYSYTGTGSTTYGPSATAPMAAGTYAVTATVAADSNYQAATSAAYAFSIAKATLTITANPQTVAYGTAASTVTGNGSYTPSGFVNSETAAVITGSASYTTTYTATTAPGASVSITPVVSGLTANNYDFTPANGTVTVTADATTISVTGSQSYTYNGSGQGPSTANVTGSNGAVTYSYSGTGSTTYAASALPPTNAGSYQIIATVAADSNYQSATSAAYAFSIDPATQPDFTVTISQNALVVNESATLSATGALGNGGVSFSVAAGDPCSVVNSTLTAVATGLCTVTATSAADVNYQVATDTLIVNVNLNPQTSLVLAASTNPIGVNGTSTLSTIGGSGSGTVSYAVGNSDPCTLSGNILTATGAGTCTVTATKAADSVYAAATSSPVSVTELPVDGGGTTPGGQVTADITGGSCAGYDPGSPRFTVPSNPPANSNFPYGVFSFTALACGPGGNVTITLTYPQPLPPGTRYLKYLNDTWVDWTQRVTISGNTVTLTITDGGEGDTNPTAGEISDPIGPSIGNNPPPANPIPTLSEWAQSMMIFLLIVTAGFYGWRMKPR